MFWTAATEDSRGLHVKGRLIREVPLAAQTYALMREGALDQLSIGFRTVRESFDRKAAARLVEEVDLREISIITFGSNDRAVINVVKAAYDPGRVAAGISELAENLEKYL